MKRLALIIPLAAIVLLILGNGGCHASAADRAKTTLDAGHVSTGKVTTANAAVDLHLATIGTEAAALRTVIADALKLPDCPPFVREALAKADIHAATIQAHATAARKDTVVIATETPKVEKSLDGLAKAVDDATNEQKRKDERLGAFIVAAAVALTVFLAVERATHLTFLAAALPAVIAGGIAFALFGRVLAWIVAVGHVIGWCLLIAGGVAAVAYVANRWRMHGSVKALFRNVEILPPLTPMEKAP